MDDGEAEENRKYGQDAIWSWYTLNVTVSYTESREYVENKALTKKIIFNDSPCEIDTEFVMFLRNQYLQKT